MLRRPATAGIGRTKRPRPNLERYPARASARREHGGRLRRIARAALWTAAASLGAWTAVQAYIAAGPVVAGWFEIREVRVTGLRTVTREDVMKRLQLDFRATLLSVSPAHLESRAATHPWIKSAAVSRLPMHVLSVEITERRPAAVLKAASANYLLDEEGAVLTAMAEHEYEDLPVVIGVDPGRLLLGDDQLRRTAQNAVRLGGLLAQSLDGRPEVDMSDPEHAVAYVQGMRFKFGSWPFVEQWERCRATELAHRAGAARGPRDIDLRFSDKVIVREREQLS